MAQALAQEGAAHRPRGGGARLGPHVFVTFENAAQPYADETRCNVAEAGLASFGKSIATAHGGSGLLANCAAPPSSRRR